MIALSTQEVQQVSGGLIEEAAMLIVFAVCAGVFDPIDVNLMMNGR